MARWTGERKGCDRVREIEMDPFGRRDEEGEGKKEKGYERDKDEGRKERARVRGAALNTEGCSTRKSRASRWCWRGIGVKTDCDGSGDDSGG